jgi:hypothetical protein
MSPSRFGKLEAILPSEVSGKRDNLPSYLLFPNLEVDQKIVPKREKRGAKNIP